MARTHPIETAALTGIAAQIGKHLSSHLAGEGGSNWWASTQGERKPYLSESIQLWALSGIALNALHHGLLGVGPATRLMDHAVNTGLWHHQIKSERGQAVGFATSICDVVRRLEKWSVRSIFMSEIAAAIDKAMKYVDRQSGAGPDTDVARLLVVPGAHIYTLWIEGQDRDSIVVAYAPKSIKGLSKTRFFTAFMFLQALSKVLKIVADSPINMPAPREPQAEKMDKKSRTKRPSRRKQKVGSNFHQQS